MKRSYTTKDLIEAYILTGEDKADHSRIFHVFPMSYFLRISALGQIYVFGDAAACRHLAKHTKCLRSATGAEEC